MRDLRDARNLRLNDSQFLLLFLAGLRKHGNAVPSVDDLAEAVRLEPARLRATLSYLFEERFVWYPHSESRSPYESASVWILRAGLEELRRRGLLGAGEA